MVTNEQILEKLEELVDSQIQVKKELNLLKGGQLRFSSQLVAFRVGQLGLERSIEILQKGQAKLEQGQTRVEQGLSRLETRQNVLEEDMKEFRIEFKQEIQKLHIKLKATSDEIIDSVSRIMNHGYNLHEDRINRIEDHLHLSPMK